VQDGHKFAQPSQLLEKTGLSQPHIELALAAFSEHSYERLKPVYDSLKEQISYDNLQFLRIYFVSQKSE
jgi:ATP-dependent DNA helicase RecQ